VSVAQAHARRRIGRFVVALLLGLLATCAALAQDVRPLLHAEAARADGWSDMQPPAEGWTPVALPDSWAERWQDFDGVVWYRLRWTQPEPAQPTGLLLRYLTMAGAVYLNGAEIARDLSLVEPLTRAWNAPHYWLLAPPLLRAGENTLLIRVSGLSAYQAGLGPLAIGDPTAMQAEYQHERLVRRDLQLFGLAVSSTMACFFGALWLMRRRESAYGWFGFMSLVWLVSTVNQVATSPWPFASTDSWQALNTSTFLVFVGSYALFTLRFCERRMPRPEAVLGAVIAIGCAMLWLAPPHAMGLLRSLWTLVGGLFLIGVCLAFLWHAWRSGVREQQALAPFMAFTVWADAHDVLVFLNVIDSNTYYASMASYVLLPGMALILAWRFVTSLRRIENFNDELIREVDAAKAALNATLAQQHALELANARIGERASLVSDLHDGFGGMLVGSIATLEHAPDAASGPHMLGVPQSLRDDLRLIIDATGSAGGTLSFAEQLAPLRRRITQALDASGIACRWQLEDVAGLQPSASHGLDLLRFIQEALTNVLKHSGARQAEVLLRRDGQMLEIAVWDDGRGFDAAAPATPASAGGAGLRNMRARAGRLGGALHIASRPGDTRLSLRLPWPQAPQEAAPQAV